MDNEDQEVVMRSSQRYAISIKINMLRWVLEEE